MNTAIAGPLERTGGGLDAHDATRDRPACRHCGTEVAGSTDVFCCAGCESVWSLLHDEGLTRYYDLRGKTGAPATNATLCADHKWLDAYDGACPARVSLDVQGIHCAACVWLLESLFSRQAGGVSIVVNPTLGKLEVSARMRDHRSACVRSRGSEPLSSSGRSSSRARRSWAWMT